MLSTRSRGLRGQAAFRAICMIIIGALSVSSGWAFNFPESGRWVIISEYTEGHTADSITGKEWHVVLKQEDASGHRLKFYTDTISDRLLCQIDITRSDDEWHMRWQDARMQHTVQDNNGLLLVPDFPVPCNLLPVGQTESERTYSIQRHAGDRIFIQKYRVTRQQFNSEEAISQGWIKKKPVDDSILIMLSVFDDLDALVVRQLWTAEGAWWLYEETPDRRSWLNEWIQGDG